MSYQDVRDHYEHRDDNDDVPPRITIPDAPKPGQRYMVATGGRWDVCDWEDAACEYCDIYDMADTPECPRCKGTGSAGHMTPYTLAADIDEADARLLVFGADLLAAGQALLADADARQDDQAACRRLYEAWRNLRTVVNEMRLKA